MEFNPPYLFAKRSSVIILFRFLSALSLLSYIHTTELRKENFKFVFFSPLNENMKFWIPLALTSASRCCFSSVPFLRRASRSSALPWNSSSFHRPSPSGPAWGSFLGKTIRSVCPSKRAELWLSSTSNWKSIVVKYVGGAFIRTK